MENYENETALGDETSDESATVSRRTVLSSLGAGAATLALGGTAGTAAANEPGDSPAATFAGQTSAATSATSSGAWSDPGVWDSGVPGAEADARIGPDASVTIEGETDPIKTLVVEGDLSFATDMETHLRAETVITMPGSALEIGTADNPISPDAEARITFVHHEDIAETDIDPERISKGLVVMGDVTMHGAETSSWHTLSTAPESGTTTLSLAEEPTGWDVDDRVVVPGLNPDANEDEEARVTAVEGATVTLDRELQHDHVPPRTDFDSYVLNLDRNVQLQSETDDVPRRGHVMFMTRPVAVEHVGFYDLGRTDKSYPFTNPRHGVPPEDVDPNPRARYPFHFHKTGPFVDEPHTIDGCVVWGSPGWGFVNHRSYAEFTDCVTYDVFGAGFVTEEGNERGRYEGNFALRSAGSGEALDSRMFTTEGTEGIGEVDDFGHGGHGFWFQGPAIAVEDNVAAGHRYYAYIYWNRPLVPRGLGPDDEINRFIATHRNFPVEYIDGQEQLKRSDHVVEGNVSSSRIRLRSFTNNTAFASAGGMDMSRHMMRFQHDRIHDWSVLEGFTVYNIGTFNPEWQDEPLEPDGAHFRGGNSAITFRFNNNVRIRNSTFVSGQGRDGWGVNTQKEYPANISVEDSEIEGFELGLDTTNADITRCFGTRLANGTNIRVNEPFGSSKIKLWDLTFERGSDGHLSLELPALEKLYPGTLFDQSLIKLDDRSVFFDEQRPDYVPVPSQEALEALGREDALENQHLDGEADAGAIIGKTNRELIDEYGIAVKGRVAEPAQTTSDSRVSNGLTGTENDLPTKAWIEAEDGELDSQWVVEEGDGASGGTYVTIDGDGDDDDTSADAGYATYEFDAAPGEYRVFGRVNLPDDDNNDFRIRIDDSDWVKWLPKQWRRPRYTWQWKDVGRYWEQDRFQLSGDSHTLEVKYSDTGGKLDKLFVTQFERKPIVYGGPEQGETGGDVDETVTVGPGGNHEFSPAALQIRPGTTVAFEWYSSDHTVTVDSQPDDANWAGVDSTHSTGYTHTQTFDVEGTYEYFCSVHPEHMRGTVTVDSGTAGDGQSTYGRKGGWPLPGRVQAEDFDTGGAGTAFADESTGNIGGEYRETQVDIGALGDTNDSYYVGWMHEGEWLEYTVNVQSAGTHDLTLRVASPQSGPVELDISVGDTDVGPVTIPQTGSWEDYTTVTVPGVQLAAGEQVFRIDVTSTGDKEYGCNLDWVEVTESDHESVPQAIDADDDNVIQDDEILDALDHWQDGEQVPNTGGQRVTDETVMDLVEMWKEETDVTE